MHANTQAPDDALERTNLSKVSFGSPGQLRSLVSKFVPLAAAVMSTVGTAGAALIPYPGTNDWQYRDFGATLTAGQGGQLLMLFIGTPTGYVPVASAVRINAHYAITAAHNVRWPSGGVTNVRVGTGTNMIGDTGSLYDGTVVAVYPGWVPGTGSFNVPDIAVIYFPTPIAEGSDAVFAPAGSTTTNSLQTFGGFGRLAISDMGSQPADFNVRGFRAPVSGVNSNNVSYTYYRTGNFSVNSSVPLRGRSSGGDSGGLVLNAQGQLVGVIIGGEGGNGSLGSTFYLDFTMPNQEVVTWLRGIVGTGTLCPADFNQDGGVDGADVQEFFASWESGSTTADVNQDGGVDGADVERFFAAWENGGC